MRARLTSSRTLCGIVALAIYCATVTAAEPPAAPSEPSKEMRAKMAARNPREDQQLALRNQNYRYQPREAAVRQQFQHPPAREALPQRQTQTERDQGSTPRPDIRRSNTAVAGKSAVARRRAESHPPPGGPATDATHPPGAQQGQPPQPGNGGVADKRETLNRQLPEAAGLLLALALLSGAGVAPR
jgi:hypothetical protein